MPLSRGWRTVVVAASGPSLSLEQAEVAADAKRDGRCHIIVVNRSLERFPTAHVDVLYSADGRFLRRYIDFARDVFGGEIWTQDHAASDELKVHWIHGKPGAGLCREPDTIYHGGNSGHQAVGLAYLFGAQRILMIGFDMRPSPTGKRHWHEDHRKPLSNGDMTVLVCHFEKMARDLKASGVECVNCTGPNSAVPYFRRGELAAELADDTVPHWPVVGQFEFADSA